MALTEGTRPRWENAPEWAQWLLERKPREFWWCEGKPFRNTNGEDLNPWWFGSGQCIPCDQWPEPDDPSLEQRPMGKDR